MWVRDALHKRELTLCFHVCEISRTVINIRTVSPSGGEYRLRRSRRESPAAAAAKSLQSCPTLCDSRDGSPPVPVILQARTLEWVVISFSNAWKWKVKVKSHSRVRLLATPWTAAYQAPPSIGFSRQEYWSGVPLPSPENHLECWKYSVSWVVIAQVYENIQTYQAVSLILV